MDLRANMIRTGILLTLFAVVCTALVALTYTLTKEPIAKAERTALLRSLHQIISTQEHDNDIFNDFIDVTDADRLGSKKPITVYRARREGKPVAALFTTIAPDGYSGAIHLLIGIYYDGTLAGVRVVGHNETPGLGDRIEKERSPWIQQFSGLSLKTPEPAQWKVRRDGGMFDQFTGATITPRAVVKAVFNTLNYFEQHKSELFEGGNTPAGEEHGGTELRHDS